MDYSNHIRPTAIDLTVNKALQIDLPTFCIHRLAISIEFYDICGHYPAGRHVAGQQEMVWPPIVPYTDMAESVEDTLVEQNVIRADKVF